MSTTRGAWAGWLTLLAAVFVTPTSPVKAQVPAIERVPILFDTDAGSDIGDTFALALILASPELDLRGITTVGSDSQTQALLLCRFLTATGRRHVPVAAGDDPQPPRPIRGQYQYYYHPDVLFNRTVRPQKESAVDFLYARLKAHPGKVTLVATGPLTNIARLIERKPDCKAWIRQIILTVGSGNKDAKATVPETNVRADIGAARTVFASGIPLIVVPEDISTRLALSKEQHRRVFSPGTALTLNLQALHQLADGETSTLGDALAVALCTDEQLCRFEKRCMQVDDGGKLVPGPSRPNARVMTSLRSDEFLKWYVDRIASCVAPAQRPAQLVMQGAFPNRVHVAEDYDSDIERRWWMCGKAETREVPPRGIRACRGVLTHDFDDLLGSHRSMYTAVIFNPVPGPPMGQNTRLSFRYWLRGTGVLRVQIYSLTNGYHRHLVLTGLQQGKWQAATVDLTAARRPDGTGGPLAEGERIDDIQFYADPTAELIIDDIVLYDAALRGEARPFPKHILFTGGFDTGKHGKDWLGDFTIVPQKGYFQSGAKSVARSDVGTPWIRLRLRGERTLSHATQLSFRYHLTGTDAMRVGLSNLSAKCTQSVQLTGLVRDNWATATVNFSADAQPRPPSSGDRIDEITFLLPAGAELIVDDVLLFEPGS